MIGSSSDTSVATTATTPTSATPTTSLPLTDLTTGGSTTTTTTGGVSSSGATIAVPQAGALSSSLVFAAGGPANNVINVTASVNAPAGVAKTANASSASGFYYLIMTVTQPTPLNLLQQILVGGAIPINMNAFVAEVVDMGTGVTLGSLPGTSDNATATFKQAGSGATLQPGKKYLVKCQGSLRTITNFTFTNKTGVSGDVYITVTCFGPEFPKDQKFYHLNSKFQLVADAMSDGTPVPGNPNQVVADYGVKVPEGASIPFPNMNGPRLYVSLGSTIKARLNKNNSADQPVSFVQPNLTADPTDPCYGNLIDFLELTVTSSTVGINMTEVNFVGLPMQVNVDGLKDGQPHEWQIGFKAGARQGIFTALANDPSYKTLAVPPQASPDAGVNTDRFLNPSYGVYNVIAGHSDLATFDPNYYKSYIDQVWTHYKTQPLTMYTDTYGTFVGKVDSSDVFVFTQTDLGLNKPPATTYKFPKPQNYDSSMPFSTNPDLIGTYAALVNNHGIFAGSPLDDVGGQIGGAMGIGICRSTLLANPIMTRKYPPYDDCKVDTYYTQAPVNTYGKAVHEWSLPSADQSSGEGNGGAYAWGLDDNCNQSSVLNVSTPNVVTSVTVILQQFTK